MWKVIVLIAAAGLQVYDIFKDFEKKNRKKVSYWFIVVCKTIVIAALAYFTYGEIEAQNLSSKINATHGTFGEQKDSFNKLPLLILGGSEFDNSAPPIGFEDSPIPPIEISSKNGQIQLYLNIRDSKGDIVARITGRTWEISNTTSIDYNNDKSGFEIISGGRVVFQIDIGIDTVIMNGLLCSESGRCIIQTNNLISPVGRSTTSQRFNIPSTYDVAPIFRYPRIEYLGKRLINGR